MGGPPPLFMLKPSPAKLPRRPYVAASSFSPTSSDKDLDGSWNPKLLWLSWCSFCFFSFPSSFSLPKNGQHRGAAALVVRRLAADLVDAQGTEAPVVHEPVEVLRRLDREQREGQAQVKAVWSDGERRRTSLGRNLKGVGWYIVVPCRPLVLHTWVIATSQAPGVSLSLLQCTSKCQLIPRWSCFDPAHVQPTPYTPIPITWKSKMVPENMPGLLKRHN